MSWRQTALTAGPAAHAHSYYDIPVFDAAGAAVVGWCPPEPGRHPGPQDAAEVGFVRVCEPGVWHRLGESRAWSWQQGPLAQWVAGGPRVVWNDREGDRIVARLHDVGTGQTRTLPGQVYAVTPDGATALSLDLMRLDVLRPGYGYPGGPGPGERRPDDVGVRAMDLGTGESRMLLSLDQAVRFLNGRRSWRDRLGRRGMHYWFNHAKIAPGGARFTVKLRWRRVGGPWTDAQGVSLTCGLDGADLRLLAPATSHVIWLDDTTLYYWRTGRPAPRPRRPRGWRGSGASGGGAGRRQRPRPPPRRRGRALRLRHPLSRGGGADPLEPRDRSGGDDRPVFRPRPGTGTVPVRPAPLPFARRPAPRRHLVAGRGAADAPAAAPGVSPGR